MQVKGDQGPSGGGKKRKHCRDPEKMAIEMSKMLFSNTSSRIMRVDKHVVAFSKSARQMDIHCTWKDNKSSPCYCMNAKLKFDTHLPDRKYLTRYSVRCCECYGEEATATHLYCTYCDEILTGSIAGPGGKISDHLITIKHVYQQAMTVKQALGDRDAREKDFDQAREYIKTLEEWSNKIRYPMRTSVKQIHFEEVLEALQKILDQHDARRPSGNEVQLCVLCGRGSTP
jgi:hypothetical protein